MRSISRDHAISNYEHASEIDQDHAVGSGLIYAWSIVFGGRHCRDKLVAVRREMGY
jgi:hypothetical protein